jgi:amidase
VEEAVMARRITRERTNLKLEFNPRFAPMARIEIGETVVFETANNFALYREMNSDDDLVSYLPLIQLNPCTGPVYVEEVEPGDTLVVEVIDIRVAEKGHICLMPKIGILHKYTKTPHTKIFRIKDGMTILNEDLMFPARPMLGTFGTTPAWPVPAIMPGPHPGNVDDTNAIVGARLHMPVFVPGALFQVGDVHANQGDSEVAMGVECDAEVTLRFAEVIKRRSRPTAFVETPTRWSIPGDAATLEAAVEIATKAATDFIMDRTGVTREEATYLMCAVGDLRISQAAVAGYNVTVRAEIPKDVDRRGRLRSAWD